MCFCVCVFQNGQNSRLVNIPKWPKGSEMINQMFLFSRPFWARVDPFWIISNNKRLFCSKASLPNLVGPQIDFCLKWSKRVPNCQKHLGLPFWTPLAHYGTLTSLPKSAPNHPDNAPKKNSRMLTIWGGGGSSPLGPDCKQMRKLWILTH